MFALLLRQFHTLRIITLESDFGPVRAIPTYFSLRFGDREDVASGILWTSNAIA